MRARVSHQGKPIRAANWKGEIWDLPPARRRRRVAAVCKSLEATYGTPRLDNPDDPLDDLIYIILSNKSSPYATLRLFRALKKRFTTWEEVLDSPIMTLKKIIKPGGLHAKKSSQIA